jgi:hypothetical protein|tara:strand:- start:21 stop:578 length:558 start_codon:yes stop_codon:yes gene_type:complete
MKSLFGFFCSLALLASVQCVDGAPYKPYHLIEKLPLKNVDKIECKVPSEGGNNKDAEKYVCGQGTCTADNEKSAKGTCQCLEPYMHAMEQTGSKKNVKQPCEYRALSKKTAFFLSIFLGFFGADWFYLSRGCANSGYVCLGIFKLFTFGGMGLWWIIDWILILTDTVEDANGMTLWDDLSLGDPK